MGLGCEHFQHCSQDTEHIVMMVSTIFLSHSMMNVSYLCLWLQMEWIIRFQLYIFLYVLTLAFFYIIAFVCVITIIW